MTIAALGKAVSIRTLSKSYGATLALEDVSLDIAAGSFCTLGASGSGKTTLLKTIAGFETYDRGEIRVGTPISGPFRCRSEISGWSSRTTRSFRI